MSEGSLQKTRDGATRSHGASLIGRGVVVSGASRGIGLAIARAFAAEGARVVMVARGRAELDERAREIGVGAIAVACDVTDSAAVDRAAVESTRTLSGPPDIVVNNAGFFTLAPVDSIDAADFDRTIDVNLVAPFRLVRAFLPAMRARGAGHLLTIGSIADRAIFPGNGAYAASKFGLRALHEVMRAELRGSGVRTTLISPAPVDTPLWDAIQPDTTPGFTPRSEMLAAESVADAAVWAATRPPSVNIDELRLSRS